MGTVATVASSWIDRIEDSRQGLIEAAKTGNRVLAAFAQADARAELIASLKDEQIQARLLKITDPELAMVELANNPTTEDRVRICAIAILSGFVPGDDQFAIFGGGRDKSGHAKPGKLYTKEAGYRTLFGHLGIVPEVQTGFPEWLPYGSKDKNVWRVSGSASCIHNGEIITVLCDETTGGIDNRISLPGYESDNVDAMAAKARRRLLQMLWSKLSPILNEPQADDETEPIEQTPPARIETQPAATVADYDQEQKDAVICRRVSREGKHGRVAKILEKSPDQMTEFQSVWDEILSVKTMLNLDAIADSLKQPDIPYSTFSNDVKGIIKWLWSDKKKELSEGLADET